MMIKRVKGTILFCTVLCMLLVWPGCLVRRETSDRSGEKGHKYTEELRQGMEFSQRFQPRESCLSAIDFAFAYDETLPREGEFCFEVLNPQQKPIYTGRIPYGVISNHTYYRVPVDLRLDKKKEYTYRVSNTNVTVNPPRVVYTADSGMHAPENKELLFQGKKVHGQALAQFVWRAPLDLFSVLAAWSFLALCGFTVAEAAECFMEKMQKTARK